MVIGDTQGDARQNTRGNAREISVSGEPVTCGKEALPKMLDPQREANLQETHTVCRRVGHQLVIHRLQDAIFFGHNFMHSVSRTQRRNVVRLAPARNSSECREKVGEGAGCLPGIWKVKWSRIRASGGVQFNANVNRGRKGVDIVDVDVRVFSF